jgi:hypothetical protein
VSEEYSDPTAESEMRRRAAWLLAMLVLVAVLLVALMVVFLKGGGSKQAGPTVPALPTGPVGKSGSPSPGGSGSTAPTSGSSTGKSSSPGASSGVHVPPRSHRHHVSCSSDLPCVAHGDIGNAVAAINSYRRQQGQQAVNGRVSDAAQQCALTNGSDCSGEWAETQLPDADGKAALQKVLPLARSLLDPGLKSLEVGWAYDPGAQQYYFALIQHT